jgi:hypothetical protein
MYAHMNACIWAHQGLLLFTRPPSLDNMHVLHTYRLWSRMCAILHFIRGTSTTQRLRGGKGRRKIGRPMPKGPIEGQERVRLQWAGFPIMTDKGRVDGFRKRPPKKSRRGIGRSVGPQASVWKGKKHAKRLAMGVSRPGSQGTEGVWKAPRTFREKYQRGIGKVKKGRGASKAPPARRIKRR